MLVILESNYLKNVIKLLRNTRDVHISFSGSRLLLQIRFLTIIGNFQKKMDRVSLCLLKTAAKMDLKGFPSF